MDAISKRQLSSKKLMTEYAQRHLVCVALDRFYVCSWHTLFFYVLAIIYLWLLNVYTWSDHATIKNPFYELPGYFVNQLSWQTSLNIINIKFIYETIICVVRPPISLFISYVQGNDDGLKFLDKSMKEITYNMPYEQLFAADVGPENPFLSKQQRSTRNILSGYVETAHLNEFEFENQRRTFTSFGMYWYWFTSSCLNPF